MANREDHTPTEKSIAADLELRLAALEAEGRCIWRREVRLQCFTHAKRAEGETKRIDYVAKLDGILIGLEVKRSPERPAELGQYLVQCMQYAQGVIGGATTDRIPQDWTGQAMLAVFLVSDSGQLTYNVQQHALAAPRLFGPANVGFLKRECRHHNCFELFLCADRAWSREWGWHRGMVNKTARSGNGQFRAADTSDLTVPTEYSHTNLFDGFEQSCD